MPAATVSVVWSNTPPEGILSTLASAQGGVLNGVVFASSSGHSEVTFTTPFTGRLVITGHVPGGADFEADIGADQQINDENWPNHIIAGNPPGIIPAGTVLNVRFRSDVGFVGDPATDYFDFMRDESLANYGTNTAPGTKTPATGSAFDNTAASGRTPGNAAAFDNSVPDASTAPLVDAPAIWSNTPPDNATANNSTAFSNAQPASITLEGEQPPVAGVTSPASPIVATQATTLLAGSNYIVQVGTRSANQTITMPDPPSLGQRIEIADISGQAATWPITVNCGTKQILDTAATSYIINRNNAVLELSYTGTAWKIV